MIRLSRVGDRIFSYDVDPMEIYKDDELVDYREGLDQEVVKTAMMGITKKDKKEFNRSRDAERQSRINFKYYSSILLLVKNENRYLKEWLDWHLYHCKFDHIYLYENSDENVREVTDRYKDKVTILSSRRWKNIQTSAYNDFLKKFALETRWIAVIDIDEFIQCDDINAFLRSKEGYADVMLQFKEYGADGHIQYNDVPVQERFTNPVDVEGNNAPKHIVQPLLVEYFRTHYPRYNVNEHEKWDEPVDGVYFKHFYTKSYEEWVEKMKRGSCDPNWLRKYEEFFWYNPEMSYLKEDGIKQIYGNRRKRDGK